MGNARNKSYAVKLAIICCGVGWPNICKCTYKMLSKRRVSMIIYCTYWRSVSTRAGNVEFKKNISLFLKE